MGALVDCPLAVAPGIELVIDIVGIGPVQGVVRWAQPGKFGVQFSDQFDLGRLAAKKQKRQDSVMVPWYLDRRKAS